MTISRRRSQNENSLFSFHPNRRNVCGNISHYPSNDRSIKLLSIYQVWLADAAEWIAGSVEARLIHCDTKRVKRTRYFVLTVGPKGGEFASGPSGETFQKRLDGYLLLFEIEWSFDISIFINHQTKTIRWITICLTVLLKYFPLHPDFFLCSLMNHVFRILRVQAESFDDGVL